MDLLYIERLKRSNELVRVENDWWISRADEILYRRSAYRDALVWMRNEWMRADNAPERSSRVLYRFSTLQDAVRSSTLRNMENVHIMMIDCHYYFTQVDIDQIEHPF